MKKCYWRPATIWRLATAYWLLVTGYWILDTAIDIYKLKKYFLYRMKRLHEASRRQRINTFIPRVFNNTNFGLNNKET